MFEKVNCYMESNLRLFNGRKQNFNSKLKKHFLNEIHSNIITWDKFRVILQKLNYSFFFKLMLQVQSHCLDQLSYSFYLKIDFILKILNVLIIILFSNKIIKKTTLGPINMNFFINLLVQRH